MTVALLFGGQGSQVAGMLNSWSAVPEVKEQITTASEVLKEDVYLLDSATALEKTRAVQLSLLILQTGVAQALRNKGVSPSYGAGHSLGAWSAAVVAGSLTFEDALRLVDIRASTMATASPGHYGMSAVIGLNRMRLSQAVDDLHDQGEEIWLSNLNSAAQSTVSGSDSALRLLEPAVAEMGAQRVKRLRVSVPAHSALMEPARTAVGEAMGDIAVDRPAFPLLANTSGRMIRTAPQVREDLVAAIDQPVQWGTGVAALAERGVTHWIQVSPGNSLIGLLRDVQDEAEAWCTDNVNIDETVARILATT